MDAPSDAAPREARKTIKAKYSDLHAMAVIYQTLDDLPDDVRKRVVQSVIDKYKEPDVVP